MMNLRSPVFRFRGALRSWPKAQPIMQEILDQTALMPGSTNFGWTQIGDELMWRSTFDDVDRMLDNFARISPMFDRLMTAAAADFNRFEFNTPVSQISRIMDATALPVQFNNAQYFETEENGEAHGFFRRTSNLLPLSEKEAHQCSVKPQYSIKDWSIAHPLIHKMVDKISSDPKCTYFSWNKVGDKLQSRGSFVDGEAVKNHLNNVKMIMDSLNAGPAKLEQFEIVGPHNELEKLKESTAIGYNPKYVEIDQETVTPLEAGSNNKKNTVNIEQGDPIVTK